jgi:hypothetical protein
MKYRPPAVDGNELGEEAESGEAYSEDGNNSSNFG